MNFREAFKSARNIGISIRPSSKLVTRTSRCRSIGQALPVAQRQMGCASQDSLINIISSPGSFPNLVGAVPPNRPPATGVSRPYLIRPKPNAPSRHYSILKCSVELFRYSRSPRMSIRMRRSWQVSTSRANRAPRWDSKSQINKAVQDPVRQDGEHQFFFSFENPLKTRNRKKSDGNNTIAPATRAYV